MVTQAEMEDKLTKNEWEHELKQDAYVNEREEYSHAELMVESWSYFCKHTDYEDIVERLEAFKNQGEMDYEDIVERLEAFKNQAEMHDWDFRHVIKMLLEDV